MIRSSEADMGFFLYTRTSLPTARRSYFATPYISFDERRVRGAGLRGGGGGGGGGCIPLVFKL